MTHDQNVIQIFQDKLADVLAENLVHGSLNSSGGNCQPKAQHFKLKLAHWRHHRSFGLVFISDPDLVIASLEVQGRKDSATMQLFQQINNPGSGYLSRTFISFSAR